jgi:hypothetical protein
MLRELVELTGLSAQVTAALADTYRGPWAYAPGAVFTDLAAAVAGEADCIHGVGQRCGDRETRLRSGHVDWLTHSRLTSSNRRSPIQSRPTGRVRLLSTDTRTPPHRSP